MQDQDFTADLASMRLAAGLSLRDLARSTGVPRSTLSDAFAGRRTPRLQTVLAIARACGADPEPWRRRWAEMSKHRLISATEAAGDAAVPPVSVAARRALADAMLPAGAMVPGRVPETASIVPTQLPRGVSGFVSREHEMALLERSGLSLIHGRPGVGKTALAVHWAHSVSSRFPDGQLFLDLRGHHPTLQPMSSAEAMGRLLGAVGLRWVPLTEDLEEGLSFWRSWVAGRKMLIVLDDAINANQIRPLLPGVTGSSMIVTSRHYLADLIVREGASSIVLESLPPDSSLSLLSHIIGTKRVAAEPTAAAAVAAACGHLPLALRLAGAVLAGAPRRSLAEMVDERETGDRLTTLEGLGRPSAVERTFYLSYRALPQDAQFLFRRLGLHPGPDISFASAALLAELSPATACRLLHMLAEAHLIEPDSQHRYRMHDLLRDYAARLVEDSDNEHERDTTRRRLLDWYVDHALAVSAKLDKGRGRLWVDKALTSAWEASEDAAATWVQSEHRNIVAVIEHDARHGTGHHAWSLVDLISTVLFRRTDVTGLIVAADACLEAACRQGDERAETAMYVRRGWLRWRAGRGEGARQDFARAHSLARQAGAHRMEAAALRGLSTSHADGGRLEEARRCAAQALAIFRADGDRNGEAETLNSLAVAMDRAARFDASKSYFDAALALYREAGSRGHIALVLGNLAHVHTICGTLTTAILYAGEAVDIASALGDETIETYGLCNGSLALYQAGRVEEAYRWAVTAASRARGLGYWLFEAAALDVLATASRGLGMADARGHRDGAAICARKAGDVVTEAEILVGAARDAYQDALSSSAQGLERFAAARVAAACALNAGLAAHTPHCQAEALGLAAACDLALGKIADSLAGARRSVAMHRASGARLAEITARAVLAHALARGGEAAAAGAEQDRAQQMLDELAVPDAAPVRRLLGSLPGAPLPRFA